MSLVLPGRAARPGPAARPAGRPDGEVVGPKPRAKSASARSGGSRIPAHVTVGLRAGPRLTILAAPRGFEAAAAAAATAFSVDIAAAQLEGSVVVIPVLRPGGRIGISDIVADDSLTVEQRLERGSYAGCIAGALSFSEFRSGLEAVGLTGVSLTISHAVADRMYSVIVKATKPTEPVGAEATAASATPPGADPRLEPVVLGSCC